MTYPAYPREVVRIMGRQMANLKQTVGYHFKRRHQLPHTPGHVRMWIEEYRRVDAGSGYSIALAMINT